MGRKLDALLRRGFKTGKFKATVALAISRLAVLKNQRQARCSIARSDVVEFLKSNSHDRALLRVEQVIKEQNMLDVFVLVEGYCQLLLERVNLLEQEKICPEELQEAVSSLIYAATRCGEFPELQEMRTIFTSCFGREFAARAVELRNNCGVNPKVIQKLSTRMPSLESKVKMLNEIASDNNIDLPIENIVSDTMMEYKESGPEEKQIRGPSGPLGVSHQGQNNVPFDPDEIDRSVRRKYKDVADAAQEAFESAAYAAAAARAAVELSRPGSTDPYTPRRARLQNREKYSTEDERTKDDTKFEKIDPVQNYDPEIEKGVGQLKACRDVVMAEFSGSRSDSRSDSFDDNVKGVGVSGDEDGEIKQRDFVFDEGGDGEEGTNGVEVGLKMEGNGNYPVQFFTDKRKSIEPLNINRRPVSVRTRKAH